MLCRVQARASLLFFVSAVENRIAEEPATIFKSQNRTAVIRIACGNKNQMHLSPNYTMRKSHWSLIFLLLGCSNSSLTDLSTFNTALLQTVTSPLKEYDRD